ncbi:DUF3046 domain-containing protein [Mobilicoccus massiliensis]|uniref:DUF3046 domain-containing protein n=1 Tax=Mobilicoccus massiliensis TaxID=1522310 RepID=UPI00058F6F74|nr:DUF3046 domain-containing protein [Mobilicoccus massiliensis]
MRESEFWRLMNDEFGESYANMVGRTQQLGELGGRTVVDALDAGVPPRRVWDALCDHMGIPAERRLGRDLPLRRGPIEE